MLAGGFGRGSDAGLGGELVGGGETEAIVPELGEDLGGVELALGLALEVSGETDGSGAQAVQVVMDGVRIPDAGVFLFSLQAAEIESIEFLPPMQAQTQYGMGGQTYNGVVVVFSRGRGPYASPLRNRR